MTKHSGGAALVTFERGKGSPYRAPGAGNQVFEETEPETLELPRMPSADAPPARLLVTGPSSDTRDRRGQVFAAAPARPGRRCGWADGGAASPCRRFFPARPAADRPAWYCRTAPSPAPRRRAPCDRVY